jgi:hypothetical protein
MSIADLFWFGWNSYALGDFTGSILKCMTSGGQLKRLVNVGSPIFLLWVDLNILHLT